MRFAGYAALFDRVDRGGDVIRPGAFAEALKRGGQVPLLWQHKAGAVIGRIEHLSSKLMIGGKQVVGGRGSPVPLPSGGSTADTEARAAISAIVTRLKEHGLID
ncbi:hypothetical protein G7077_11200 [Sphingomonas piscis]|uniref:Prohead serine protease domain-containing protein n=1 Tax=Sphingomonas piscis TaxID=2714943 RepID=A0A6G7YRM4_9SPHN|nr:hypothetical protein G7077_11200 [Sphingomonas piscis]